MDYYFAIADEYELRIKFEENFSEVYHNFYSIELCEDDLIKRMKEVDAAEVEKLKCSWHFPDSDSSDSN